MELSRSDVRNVLQATSSHIITTLPLKLYMDCFPRKNVKNICP